MRRRTATTGSPVRGTPVIRRQGPARTSRVVPTEFAVLRVRRTSAATPGRTSVAPTQPTHTTAATQGKPAVGRSVVNQTRRVATVHALLKVRAASSTPVPARKRPPFAACSKAGPIRGKEPRVRRVTSAGQGARIAVPCRLSSMNAGISREPMPAARPTASRIRSTLLLATSSYIGSASRIVIPRPYPPFPGWCSKSGGVAIPFG